MRTRRRQGSAMLGPGADRLSPRTGGLEPPPCHAAFPGSRAVDPVDGRRCAGLHRWHLAMWRGSLRSALGTSAGRRLLVALIIAVIVVAGLLGAGVFVILNDARSLPAFIQPLVGRQAVHILGTAMEPTLRADRVVSFDTRAYAHQSPQRGDIVLFRAPDDPSRRFVKRIIA